MLNQHGSGERLDFVQALRGIAALAVVLYHAHPAFAGGAYLHIGDRIFSSGYAGVDLFFVISGMIMVHATWHLRGSLREATTFLAKRFARIWPVYVVTTFLFVLAANVADHYLATSRGLIAMAKALCFYPGTIGGAPMMGLPPLNVGWTLVYEFWFYVVFAMSLLAGRLRWAVLTALFGGFLIVVPELVTGGVHTDAYANYGLRPAVLGVLANPMMWEFGMGVVIGVLYKSSLRIRNRLLLDAIALASIAAVLWQLVSSYRSGFGPLRVGLALAVMLLALALRDKERALRVPRVLIWLGDISFSLYLVHQIARVALLTWLPEPLVTGPFFAVVWIALALGLAHLSWRVLERGLAERFRGWLLAHS